MCTALNIHSYSSANEFSMCYCTNRTNYVNRAVNSEQGKAKEWLDRSLISAMLFSTRYCEKKKKMFRERTFGQVARFLGRAEKNLIDC